MKLEITFGVTPELKDLLGRFATLQLPSNGTLDRIEAQMQTIERQTMKTIDDLLALGEKTKEVEAGAIAVVNGFREEIAKVLKDASVKVATQEQIDKMFEVLSENLGPLIGAINKNTESETEADVAVVQEFKDAPPQKLDEPEGGGEA